MKFKNLMNVLLGDCKLEDLISNLLRLKDIYSIPIEAIVNGMVDPNFPTSPIALEDMEEIIKVVGER